MSREILPIATGPVVRAYAVRMLREHRRPLAVVVLLAIR